MSRLTKLKFPKITRIALRHFSLYALKPTIDLRVSDGVFCLAGANGLGKSTFLAAVNFGLTGIVPNPSQAFLGLEDFSQDRSAFSKDYFSGRITEKDRKRADVSLEFNIGCRSYSITRSVFAPKGLDEFTIHEEEHKPPSKRKILETTSMSPSKRHDVYAKNIVKDIGLDSFDQFAFLQHYVLTFDERRDLVFWTPKILERTLYLAFGVDPNLATRADKIRREWDKEGSHARNTTQEAKNVAERIKFIESLSSTTINDPKDYELVAKQENLSTQRDELQARIYKQKNELSDAELSLANISATQLSLRNEYEAEFDKHVRRGSHMKLNPLVINSIEQNRCTLCGTSGKQITERIREKANADSCPLCDSALNQSLPDSGSVKLLKQIDKRISQTKELFDEAYELKKRLFSEVNELGDKLLKAERAITEFERVNARVLERLRLAGQKPNELLASLERLRERWNELNEKKKRHYEKRDEKKSKLVELQRKLSKQYADAEEDFVPLFQKLALSFVGISLDVNLETKETKTETGISLLLTLKGSKRRFQYQLSESQKYFIDIALRMALAQYMSDDQNRAALFIDTPEGSLDIAYEKGAGDMFASFVKSGHDILMTANINSSQILRTLAEACGSAKMRVQPMIKWAPLSTIQEKEPKLFTNMLKSLQEKLNARKPRVS